MRRPKPPKPVAYTLLEPNEHPAEYRLLRKLLTAYHEDVEEARFALAWCRSWKTDVDGHKKLGMCRKATDLDRELAPYDFVVLLNEGFWTDPTVTDLQREALLDHELCHAEVARDKYGSSKRDANERLVFRIRRHDIEEFTCIGERHGLWKRDLEAFAAALRRSKQQPDLLEAK
jgi:Putative phage metallopeptidase